MKIKNNSIKELKKDKDKRFRIDFKRIRQIISQPKQVFSVLENENHNVDWKTPIVVVSVILIFASLLSVSSSSSSTSAAVSTNTGVSANSGQGGMGRGIKWRRAGRDHIAGGGDWYC